MMRRIDERTVELTDQEMEAKDIFDDLLDQGYGIPDAVAIIRAGATVLGNIEFSEEFWEYLGR